MIRQKIIATFGETQSNNTQVFTEKVSIPTKHWSKCLLMTAGENNKRANYVLHEKMSKRGDCHRKRERSPEIAIKRSSRITENKVYIFLVKI